MRKNFNTETHLRALSLLALGAGRADETVRYAAALSPTERDRFLHLAEAHHVVIRALDPLARMADEAGYVNLARVARVALARERARIERALNGLQNVCDRLEDAGCAVTVMKTLDHWPDFGSDLDLIVRGDEAVVVRILKTELGGRRCMRTMSDWVAHKRSFALPGLPEQVEAHVNRLGPAGEHSKLAARFIDRRTTERFGTYLFAVPAPEERLIAAALQRMYRHLYVRICDICNLAALMDGRRLDFTELRNAAGLAGIWPGVACEYVEKLRGHDWNLQADVIGSARFGSSLLRVRHGDFFSFPAFPHGLALYAERLKQTAVGGDVPGVARLTLIPPMASLGAVAHLLFGSSERVW
jgi:hypothetical protein